MYIFQFFSLANDNEENINCFELSSSSQKISNSIGLSQVKGLFSIQLIELIVIVNLMNSYR